MRTKGRQMPPKANGKLAGAPVGPAQAQWAAGAAALSPVLQLARPRAVSAPAALGVLAERDWEPSVRHSHWTLSPSAEVKHV